MKSFLRGTSSTCVRELIGIGVLSGLLTTTALAKNDDGPNGVKHRVELLESQVAALQLKQLPVEANVDCGSGGSISQALAANADGLGQLTILVTGTCVETVRISRSNVVLQGQGGAVLQAPVGALFIVNVDSNASNVTVRDLTIQGSSTGAVVAQKGAQLVLRDAIVQQAGAAVMAMDNGVVDVTGSTLRNSNNGAYAARGGVVSISNSTLENNSVGVISWKAGTVTLTSSLPDYSAPTSGVIVQNNTTGALVRAGGFLELADATIRNNTATGVVVDSGGAANFYIQLNGNGNRVTGHPGVGVLAAKNSSIVFSDNTNVITANGRGIVCSGNPSYIIPPGFSVTGNTLGDIVNCIP